MGEKDIALDTEKERENGDETEEAKAKRKIETDHW